MNGPEAQTFDLVIRRAQVFDGRAVLPGLRDVGTRGGQIAAVSEAPLGGRSEVDAEGGWLMPGLIDTHLHFFDFMAVTDAAALGKFVETRAPALLQQFLDKGITAIKSVGDPTDGILDLRDRVAAGTLRGPRLHVTGCGLTGREGHPASTIFAGNSWFRSRAAREIDSPQMMCDVVHQLADRKVDAIKLLSEGACACSGSQPYVWANPVFPNAVELHRLPKAVLRAGIEVAHERGLRVTVHTVQQSAALEALEAGADGLEHGVTVEPITDPALIAMMLERKATYAPTLWIHGAVHPESGPNTKQMADAGVRIVLGSDTFCGRGSFGENSIEEAELMEAAGVEPVRVLAAATSEAALHLERGDLGEVAPGKRADLILLRANPVEKVSNLRKLAMTVLNGEIVVDRRQAG